MHRLILGKSEEVLKTLPDDFIDSVVTDPPYHLTSIVKRFGGANAAPAGFGTDGAFSRASAGFMGKKWDGGDIAFRPDFWAEVLRVLKPGGYLLAFSGSRTYHRMAVGIEDAGFEIRDQIMWLYGSGFPKSHNLEGQFEGWGSALKPAHEPICMARKPLIGTIADNMGLLGTGAINIDAGRGDGDRWPANFIHDGLEEEWAKYFYCPKASSKDRDEGLENFELKSAAGLPMRSASGARGGEGLDGTSTDRRTKRRNTHPTVKPTELMKYLCKLVTRPGGLILDPFMGSGSTGKAAVQEGFSFIGIDAEEEYYRIAKARIK